MIRTRCPRSPLSLPLSRLWNPLTLSNVVFVFLRIMLAFLFSFSQGSHGSDLIYFVHVVPLAP